MRVAVLTALATVSLLGACRQSETPANNSAASNETAAATASSNSTTPAAAPVTAERAQEIFHTRHEGMEDFGKNSKKSRQALVASSPDLATIRTSGAAINDLASRSSNWFPAGTGQAVLPKTRALPAIWEKPDDFAAKQRDFEKAAGDFNTAAARGDVNAIKSHFDALGKTCKACHDTYRAEEHPK